MGSNNSPFGSGVLQGFLSRLWCWRPPEFLRFFAFTTHRLCVAKAEKTRIRGGTLKGHFQPPKSRHAWRGNPVLDPPLRTREESACVPGFPRFSLPRSSFFIPHSLAPPERTDSSRHGSHRCCGKAGGLRLQRTDRGAGSIQVPRDSNIMRHVSARDRP